MCINRCAFEDKQGTMMTVRWSRKEGLGKVIINKTKG